jgi:sugar phosphate isomerase/epimerase
VSNELSRREWLTATTAVPLTLPSPLKGEGNKRGTATAAAAEEKGRTPQEPFGYCLNTSTVRGQKLKLPEVVAVAAKAGFRAIEPWVSEIDEYIKGGGNLKDLARLLRGSGLEVPSAISFTEWVVDDDGRRKKAVEQLKREMDWLSQIGGRRIAAPPRGATEQAGLDLARAAERYRAILELGDRTGVVPQVEFWGPSKSLNRLSAAMFVAVQSRHPRACVLPDVYHLYKGNSGFAGLRLLSGNAVHVIHANDYPANPPRATVTDAHRVYPGDGVAPWKEIVRNLRDAGFRGFLSLELFNRDYWMRDALTVARVGLEKMRSVVKSGLV